MPFSGNKIMPLSDTLEMECKDACDPSPWANNFDCVATMTWVIKKKGLGMGNTHQGIPSSMIYLEPLRHNCAMDIPNGKMWRVIYYKLMNHQLNFPMQKHHRMELNPNDFLIGLMKG